MAFHAKAFWREGRFKDKGNQRNDSSGQKSTLKARTCYNCNNKFHFIADCPYENKEDNGGKLVPKKRGKFIKKSFVKKSPPIKKQSKALLTTLEEHSTDESDEEEDYDTNEILERNEEGIPIYKENSLEETKSDDPMNLALARQDKLNPSRQLCIWKKMISFLGASPVKLKKNEWMPAYCDNSRSKVEGDGKWHVRCSIVDPNGNEHRQGYQTTTMERQLSRFTS